MTNRPAEAGAVISARTLRLLWAAYLLAALAVGLVLLDCQNAGLALATLALFIGSWALWDSARAPRPADAPVKRAPASASAVAGGRSRVA